MKRHLMLFAVITLVVFGVSGLPAQNISMGQKQTSDDDFPQLTAEQRDQMDKLRSEHQKVIIPLRAELRLKMVEYHDMLRDEASQNSLNGKLDDIGKIKIKLSKARLDHQLKISNILTPEQKAFFKERGGPWRGMGSGCGMGSDFGKGCHERMGRGMNRPDRPGFGEWEPGDGEEEFGEDMDDDDGFWGMHGNCQLPCPNTCKRQ